MSKRRTPVMQQHADAKRAHPDAILFFRLGDFYEMFGDDAVRVSKLLDLTLTSRNKGKPDEVPMAGVPHHAAHGYIARLLESGEKVAICEQMADPSKVKGIVPREVVRVITPGTVTNGDQLDASTNNWLCALHVTLQATGVAFVDVSTGELLAARVSDLSSTLIELGRQGPREILVGHDEGALDLVDDAVSAIRATIDGAAVRVDEAITAEDERASLGSLLQEASDLDGVVVSAAARALRYAARCYPGRDLPVQRLGVWEPGENLRIDTATRSHLELVESASGNRAATLLGVIDRTKTPPGARLLRRRLLAPLRDVQRIRRRLDQVDVFVANAALRREVRGHLSKMGDLERMAVRAAMGEATPRDLGAIRDALDGAAAVVAALMGLQDVGHLSALGLGPDGEGPPPLLEGLRDDLTQALVERPPAQAKEGGVFRKGFDAELDELDELRRSGTQKMVAFEGELRASTGISNLKVKFTRVFGWYVEVSRSNSARVPAGWRRKQTVASGERYTTEELDALAERIASAEEAHRERELDLLRTLYEQVREASGELRRLSARLAEWDVAAALADVANDHDYTRPAVEESTALEIREGRHPVVERLAAAGRFVPNDVSLDFEGERLWLITGPNMAGKSTFLRQNALIIILAQMGAFVPARHARIGVVDRVLSRVGASDNLAQGESTFMVEMRETAQILRHSSERSFVILDEIGRGTSTFDGLAIAWAVAEYLDDVIGCRALFATHYHELTELGEESAHVRNYSVSARELDEDVIFLHRLVPGAASRSYGVAVAKLAGLPEVVLARARALLAGFEGESIPSAKSRAGKGRPTDRHQLDLFAKTPETGAATQIIETLRQVELDRLTGLEALQLLHQLKKKLDE